MRSFWDDWADTARMRDHAAAWRRISATFPPLHSGNMAGVSILHVVAHDPRVKRPGEVSTTPRPRWAPERWCIAWKPHGDTGSVLDYRILSYTTVN